MGRIFKPARFGGATAPETQSLAYTAAQTFIPGAVLIFAAGGAGTVEEGGANPTPLVGVALDGAATKPGYEVGHSSKVKSYTGRVAEASVAIANRVTVFSGRGSTAPLQTHIDAVYGIAATSGEWYVNIADESNTRVEVVDIDTTVGVFFFKFMSAHLALP